MRERLKETKNRFADGFLPGLVYLVVRLIYATMRVRIIGGEIPQALHDKGIGIINVFWHARLLMVPFAYTGKKVHVLISSHGDGKIIANVMKKFGFGIVYGSSSKEGKKAYREMVKLARSDRDLAITPDGPRGPAETVKPGVANLAWLTGRPVVPLAYSGSRVKRFSSWDRFLVPYPFSRGVIVWGDPVYRRDGEDPETFRQRIERALKEITAKADGYFAR
jgi:lysophospholipid acyltransferase (LPLAT)-like uncharacterized protein